MRRPTVGTFLAVSALIAVPFALTAGSMRVADTDQSQGSTLHEVQITVNTETGEFTYSQDPVNATRGDRIQWSCDQGNWSVHFIDKTPLADKLLRGQRAGPKQLPIRGDAEDGTYKYFVAVAIGEDVYTDDPEVIVGPRG